MQISLVHILLLLVGGNIDRFDLNDRELINDRN